MPARQSAGPVLDLFCLPSVAFLVASAPSTAPPRLTKTTPQAAQALVSVHTSACGAAICAASCAALPSRWLPGRPRALGRHEPCTDDRPQGGGAGVLVARRQWRKAWRAATLCTASWTPASSVPAVGFAVAAGFPVAQPPHHAQTRCAALGPTAPDLGSSGRRRRLAACVELARCYRRFRVRPAASSPAFRNPFARPCGGRGEPRALRWRSRSSCSRHPLSRSTCHPR